MSDHLPECTYSPGQPGFGGINSGIPSTQPYLAPSPCICDELRACEQRIEEAMDRAWQQTVDIAVAHTRTSTLDAARRAVEATFTGWCKDYMNCTDYEHACGNRREIIAAIDALRGDRNE